MTTDEELEQLRAENTALCDALRRKDEELEQSQQANQDLREGLKQAIIAIDYHQEHVKTLEGLIEGLQEHVQTLERQQAKDSHNSSLPPSSDRFVRPPRVCGRRAAKSLAGRRVIVGTVSSKWRALMRYSFILSNAVSTVSTICVSNQQQCQSDVK